MKILLIKRDKIGDLILTTPLLELIKIHFPKSELHLLANTYNGWAVENDPAIDHLWLYRRAREGTRTYPGALIEQIWQLLQLRRQRYDWIVVANDHASRRANYRARKIACPTTRVVAYCDNARDRSINVPLVAPDHGHEVDRLVALLRPMGIYVAPTDVPLPRFTPNPAWITAADRFLASRGLVPGAYVMLGVGARRPPRQPLPTQIVSWARTLHDRFGLHSVFTWTPGPRDDPRYPGDDELAAAVLAEPCAWLHPYQGDLGTVVGLTWRAKTSVYPDSGLMHVAATCPGGVIGLFADPARSSSPDDWGPRGKRVSVVVAPSRIADLPDEVILSAIANNLEHK